MTNPLKNIKKTNWSELGYQARLITSWTVLCAGFIGYIADHAHKVIAGGYMPYLLGAIVTGLVLFFGNKR